MLCSRSAATMCVPARRSGVEPCSGRLRSGEGLAKEFRPLGAHTQEDVLAVLLDPVDLIYVGRVVLANPALHDIPCLVAEAVDRVIAFVTEERVRTAIAVDAVVAIPANHRVVASSSVEQVRTC